MGLRLTGSIGAIKDLPGYNQGWWSIQDSSAQWVSYLLDPQPGETIIDACAAVRWINNSTLPNASTNCAY